MIPENIDTVPQVASDGGFLDWNFEGLRVIQFGIPKAWGVQ